MREKRKDAPKAAPPTAPAPKSDPVLDSLARIEREIRRIEKRLGMKQIYGDAP